MNAKWFTMIAAAAAFTLATATANAASFMLWEDNDDSSNMYLEVTGEIERGDYEKLIAYTRNSISERDRVTVELNSPGGNLDEGMSMGAYIRRMGWETIVRKGEKCASACGLMWLAGKTRWVQTGANTTSRTA